MENSSSYIFCSLCKTRMKRQVLGSNIFYYCRHCGCLSSETSLFEETKAINVQKSVSINKTSSVIEHKLSEASQRTVVET